MLVLQNWVMHILLIQGQQAAPAFEIEENLNLSSNIFLVMSPLHLDANMCGKWVKKFVFNKGVQHVSRNFSIYFVLKMSIPCAL